MKQISNEQLTNILEEIIDERTNKYGKDVEVSKEMINVIFDVIAKIINMPPKTWTSIAQLINYDPKNLYVPPLFQGTVASYVHSICKKIGIELIQDKAITGLPYVNKFKKN